MKNIKPYYSKFTTSSIYVKMSNLIEYEKNNRIHKKKSATGNSMIEASGPQIDTLIDNTFQG